MNLILRVTIVFVFVSLIVFLIGGVISFNIMMREVNQEQRRFLIERLDRVSVMLERRPPKDTIDRNKFFMYPLAEFTEERVIFSDTLVMHSQLERIEPHLKVEAIRNVNGKSYAIILYDIIIEPDDIQDGLVESLVKMYLILLLAVIVIGFLSSYYFLKPFNETLSVIKSFSLRESGQKVHFPRSGIRELRRLNQFLEDMTHKVRSDYQLLKEFSENASHEIQTPIAIIQGKLEVLMEGEHMSEEQIGQIISAQNTLKRLSNLSHSLSILTKIENKEFDKISRVNLSDRLNSLLDEFRELIDLKSIMLETEITPEVFIEADDVLLDLLLTNLINNSIRHNWENGDIQISLTQKAFEVVNSGKDLDLDPDELFTRFKKSNQSSSSLGLGLAIVKKICDFYGFSLKYTQSGKQHRLKVVFRKN
ncbi:MAG: HAMP domain-containing sensor histidine kinase [Cyclobacteriaceae bacterium]